ncbi:hypothetical protein PVK06_005895 [Gossypium arboreum]|uniref:Reverse transcriptase n=1 Tax=Gossypium arboreum TaxID=29729 RepID=A0ABR0QWU4_GOSAR|nr:hypothetical protein PVK06_005895 [Gossypium arboreum]
MANSAHLLLGIDRCIQDEDNNKLTMNYTKEEIEAVVFEMGPTKAPGEDRLPRLIYQKCWPIVENNVIGFCLRLLNGDMEASLINSANIVLIPNISNPSNMTHFRPISLCNFLYKFLAKAIANRFKGVIGKCIVVAHSAFVAERLISDNLLLAYKILNTLKQKRVGKIGFMAVKLDMSKAYDRVQWDFIKQNHIAEYEGFRAKKSILNMVCNQRIEENLPIIKIQFDAAFNSKNFRSATGLLVWGKTNEYLVSKSFIHYDIASPFSAEAYAGLEAVKLGIEMCFQEIQIQEDSLTVIKRCQANTINYSVIGSIIRGIQVKKSGFQKIEFKHILKMKNMSAHNIVKTTLKRSERTCLEDGETICQNGGVTEPWARNLD